MAKIGFLGAGNMAEAIIRGVIAAKTYKPEDILISDINSERVKLLCRLHKVKAATDNCKLVKSVDILVLSVKPQNMTEVLNGIKDVVCKNVLVVSIAAGVTTAKIQGILKDAPIVRVMPNTPALVGHGAAALYATPQAASRLSEAEKIFSSVGIAVTVDDENLLDAVTAVSGSGPAYFFLLAEEMIKSAVRLGLDKGMAEKLVLQTAKGAGLLAVEAAKQNHPPQTLRKNVTSPGGTTEAAIKIFAEYNFERIVGDAIAAAAKRSKELSAG